jgi:hypothetical protein
MLTDIDFSLADFEFSLSWAIRYLGFLKPLLLELKNCGKWIQ